MIILIGYLLAGFLVATAMFRILGSPSEDDNTGVFLLMVLIWPLPAFLGLLYYPWLGLTKYVEFISK